MLVSYPIQAQERRSIDTMVTKVELLEDYKKYGKRYVHIHDSQNQCQCTALCPQLLVALKSARRLAISAARCPAKRCLPSGVTLVSPLGCRTKGLIAKFEGGLGHELLPPGAVLRQGSPFG